MIFMVQFDRFKYKALPLAYYIDFYFSDHKHCFKCAENEEERKFQRTLKVV